MEEKVVAEFDKRIKRAQTAKNNKAAQLEELRCFNKEGELACKPGSVSGKPD